MNEDTKEFREKRLIDFLKKFKFGNIINLCYYREEEILEIGSEFSRVKTYSCTFEELCNLLIVIEKEVPQLNKIDIYQSYDRIGE